MTDCLHGVRALRRRTLSNGAVQYVRQCVNCGNPGVAIKRAVAEAEMADIPPFDEDLQDRWWDSWRKESFERQQGLDWERDRKHAEWLDEHRAYLRTEAWAKLRRKVLIRAKGLCEGCMEAPASEVHHTTYAHWRAELLFELVALCRDCHERAHEQRHA